MFKLQTDYALRTLIYLARVDRRATVAEIAAAHGISRDHLFKVVQQLVRMGFVVTHPGRTGGVQIGRDAGSIRCGDVVAGFEGRNGLLPWVIRADGAPADDAVRAIRDVIRRAEDAMYDALERVTIADLAMPRAAVAPRGASAVA